MICCVLAAALISAVLYLPRRLFASRRQASVEWRPGGADDTRKRNILSAFADALNGLRELVAHEANFRIHLVAAALVIALAMWLQVTPDDWRWLGLAITLVLLSEAPNTAVERTCDAVTLDHHPGIRIAKDIGAASVLIAVVAACVIGALTLWPYVWAGGLCG